MQNANSGGSNEGASVFSDVFLAALYSVGYPFAVAVRANLSQSMAPQCLAQSMACHSHQRPWVRNPAGVGPAAEDGQGPKDSGSGKRRRVWRYGRGRAVRRDPGIVFGPIFGSGIIDGAPLAKTDGRWWATDGGWRVTGSIPLLSVRRRLFGPFVRAALGKPARSAASSSSAAPVAPPAFQAPPPAHESDCRIPEN